MEIVFGNVVNGISSKVDDEELHVGSLLRLIDRYRGVCSGLIMRLGLAKFWI
jgi:hypothetical protein